KKKIISYLRLIRISNLPIDIKIQVKNNYLVSILVLLMTGITTLIQMKNHPIVLELLNNTILRLDDWGRN
ncbi:Gustatory receptor, partial [Aphis craccivora]